MIDRRRYHLLVIVSDTSTDVSQDGAQDFSQPFGFDINVMCWSHCLLVRVIVVRRCINKVGVLTNSPANNKYIFIQVVQSSGRV